MASSTPTPTPSDLTACDTCISAHLSLSPTLETWPLLLDQEPWSFPDRSRKPLCAGTDALALPQGSGRGASSPQTPTPESTGGWGPTPRRAASRRGAPEGARAVSRGWLAGVGLGRRGPGPGVAARRGPAGQGTRGDACRRGRTPGLRGADPQPKGGGCGAAPPRRRTAAHPGTGRRRLGQIPGVDPGLAPAAAAPRGGGRSTAHLSAPWRDR